MRLVLRLPDLHLEVAAAAVTAVLAVPAGVGAVTDVPGINKRCFDRAGFGSHNIGVRSYLFHLVKLSFKSALVASFVFVFLSVLTNYLGPLKLSLNIRNVDQKNLFSVDGLGKASVKPDIALVSMGFVVQDPSVVNGQKLANEVINKTTSALKSLGINEKDIKTTSYNIYPNYNYLSGKQSLNGYTINIELSLKIHNFDRLNQAIDTATASGINQIGSVTFDVENKEAALNLARAEAVKKAMAKASRLSSLVGLKLGRIVNVREGQTFSPQPYAALSADKGLGGGETQVQPGQSEVSLTVTLDYETL